MSNTPSITSHLVAWLLFFFDWPPVVWVQPHILAYRIHPTFFPPIIWRRRTILPDSILRRMTGSPSPQIPDTSRILVTYYLIQGNNGILDKDNFSHSFKRVVQGPLCCWKCFIYHRLCTVGFSPPDTLVCPYVWLHSAATHWDCFGAALPCSTLWNTSLFDKAVLDT